MTTNGRMKKKWYINPTVSHPALQKKKKCFTEKWVEWKSVVRSDIAQI